MKTWTYIGLFLLIPCLFYAQPIGLDLLHGKDEIKVPFQQRNGLLLVDVRIAKKLPLKFIFDTGAEHTVLFHKQLTDLLGFEYSTRIKILGSDLAEEQYALVTRNAILELPDVTSVERDILVLEEDIFLLRETLGFEVDGILGGSFFRGMILKIDYKKSQIIIRHPERFEPPKDYHTYDIEIFKNKPYLNVEVLTSRDSLTESKLLLDTGASLPLLLHTNTDTLLSLPDLVIDGNLGIGLGGALSGYMGKTPLLKIQELEFNNILTAFQDLTMVKEMDIRRNGIFGNLLLERFGVIIDYLNSKLYLKPTRKFNKQFGYDRSGLIIIAVGKNLKQFYVKKVVKGSPADEAGVKAGDLIKKINWFRAKRWNLGRINKLLQKREGRRIKLKLEREGEEIKTEFRLRDLLKSKEAAKE